MAEKDDKQEPKQEPPAADPQAPPTPEQMEGLQEIAAAGQEAAVKGEDPAAAMKGARDRTGMPFSDEDIDRIAEGLTDKLMSSLREAGAFDPPPEPVAPPAQPTAPEPPAPGEPTPPAPGPAPRKSWAEKFLG